MTNIPSEWKNIDVILFDMDGVITSEEAYWDAAGLTIRELLESPGFLGLNPTQYTPVVDLFYQRLSKSSRMEWRKYLPDKLIGACKSRGINNNWDLTYLIAGIYLAPIFSPLFNYFSVAHDGSKGASTQSNDADAVKDMNRIDEALLQETISPIWNRLLELNSKGQQLDLLRTQDMHLWGDYFRTLGRNIVPINKPEKLIAEEIGLEARGLELLNAINNLVIGDNKNRAPWFDRSSPLWHDCRALFQGWYLGEALYETTYQEPLAYRPKPGLIHQEEPLLGRQATHKCLSQLKEAGYTLGVATGRPRNEILTPLQRWEMLDYFGEGRISTHDEAEKAEAELKSLGAHHQLSKPHPYIFLRARYPEKSPLQLVEMTDAPPEELKRTLIVGDAQADIWAAQKIHAPCAAVMTGAAGKADPQGLRDSKPDAIFDNVIDLTEQLIRLKK
ncbi:MAG: HAD hydrolase-like protein [Candidatus Hinthialibacter antarcticus]|nr:HAD hydrolase-like protein [Candidatus Hinthialibacter antarcticus]